MLVSNSLRNVLHQIKSKSRCNRFLHVNAVLCCEPKPGKILEKKQSTPRQYHDEETMEKSDLPLRFTSTKASEGSRSEKMMGVSNRSNPRPPYERFSIALSSAVFCFYFMVLREESDIDQFLTTNPRSTYEVMPNLEKEHLEAAILNYKIEGRSTKELEAKLDQVRAELAK